MTWTVVDSVPIGLNWQFTDVVEGELFRLTLSGIAVGDSYHVAQAQVNDDGSKDLFDLRVVTVSGTRQLLNLIKPDLVAKRQIALKQLPRSISLESELRRVINTIFLQPQQTSFVPVQRANWTAQIEVSDAVVAKIDTSDIAKALKPSFDNVLQQIKNIPFVPAPDLSSLPTNNSIVAALKPSFDAISQKIQSSSSSSSSGFTSTSVTDPDVTTYQNNIASVSGSISSNSIAAVQSFIVAAKNHGYWNDLIEVYPLAGDNLAAATVKAKSYQNNPAVLTNNGFTDADYKEDNGIQGNFTGCFDTNFSIPNFDQFNFSVGLYIASLGATSPGRVLMGSSYGATGNSDRFYMADINGEAAIGGFYQGSLTNKLGLLAMGISDNSSTGLHVWNGSTQVASGNGNQIWQKAGTIYLGSGSGNNPCGRRIAFAFLGKGSLFANWNLFFQDASNLLSSLGRIS